VLHYGYLNSYHHTGAEESARRSRPRPRGIGRPPESEREYRKIDEIPFDFIRRRMSVVVEDENRLHTLICKGAVDEVLTSAPGEHQGGHHRCSGRTRRQTREIADDLNGQGFRVIAVAYKEMPGSSNEAGVWCQG